MYEDLLPHDRLTEPERLDAMARAHDPDTRAAILRLDLPPNPRCLDLGSGRGTVSIWLAETFPNAEVVAVDLDHKAFKEHSLDNLRLIEMDVQTNDLGASAYDLVHCRALLGFLDTRVEILEKVRAALRPRGAFVVTEMDFGVVASDPDPFWSGFWTAYLEFAASQGWDLNFGSQLPEALSRAGFNEIDARYIAPVLNAAGETPGSAESETWSLTLATLAPGLIDGGFMSEEILRAALSRIRDDQTWTLGPGFMVATATVG